IKDLGKKQAAFINPELHTETNSMSQIAFTLNEFMGLPSRELYKNTAFISHSEIAKIETNRDFINALQNVTTENDADVNVQNILHAWDAQVKQMRLGLDRHANEPGVLKATQDRILSLEKALNEAKALSSKLLEAMGIAK